MKLNQSEQSALMALGIITAITAAIVVSLLTSGCSFSEGDYEVEYGASMVAAIEAWEDVIGPVSDECHDRAVGARVIEADYFPDSCIPGKPYVGCYEPTDLIGIGDTIYIYYDRSNRKKALTGVHEYIHLLSRCEQGYLDALHLDEKLWEDYGDDTVEAVGKGTL